MGFFFVQLSSFVSVRQIMLCQFVSLKIGNDTAQFYDKVKIPLSCHFFLLLSFVSWCILGHESEFLSESLWLLKFFKRLKLSGSVCLACESDYACVGVCVLLVQFPCRIPEGWFCFDLWAQWCWWACFIQIPISSLYKHKHVHTGTL